MIVSIITVTYNSAATIAHTLQSVAEQTYPHIEHIIIDGASQDNTMEIIDAYRGRVARVVSEPDQGIYDAINKGIALASGDVIGILNSDDILASQDTIAHIVEALEHHHADIVYGDLQYCHFIDEKAKVVRYWKSNAFREKDLKFGWMPPHPTLYCRREVIEQYGLYNTKFRISGDYDFMLRILDGTKVQTCYLPEVIVKMGMGGVSNRDFGTILQKMREDYTIICQYALLRGFTLLCKNLRKLGQFK